MIAVNREPNHADPRKSGVLDPSHQTLASELLEQAKGFGGNLISIELGVTVKAEPMIRGAAKLSVSYLDDKEQVQVNFVSGRRNGWNDNGVSPRVWPRRLNAEGRDVVLATAHEIFVKSEVLGQTARTAHYLVGRTIVETLAEARGFEPVLPNQTAYASGITYQDAINQTGQLIEANFPDPVNN